jgi:hypothetical protein
LSYVDTNKERTMKGAISKLTKEELEGIIAEAESMKQVLE